MSDLEPPVYSSSFYTHNAQTSGSAAGKILGIVHDLYHPTSIVDIGCGSGAWLAAAESLGFTVLRGYDGPWADPHAYTSKNIDFVPLDLEKYDVPPDTRYDLAMSVEVAEHLSESRATMIVSALCAASDVVLFGAAIPNQGGLHHIHEMPQTYWIDLFAEHGYEPFDIIRPAIWNDEEVAWWFRQNTLLFVKADSSAIDRDALHDMERPIWNLVHPRTLARPVATRQRLRRQRRVLTRQLENSRNREAELKRKLARSEQRVAKLERGNGDKTFREVATQDLPRSLRPAARKVWHALPPAVRTAIRPPAGEGH